MGIAPWNDKRVVITLKNLEQLGFVKDHGAQWGSEVERWERDETYKICHVFVFSDHTYINTVFNGLNNTTDPWHFDLEIDQAMGMRGIVLREEKQK